MTFVTPQVTDFQVGYSLEVAGQNCSVLVYILSETVPPDTTGVQVDGVECTRVLLVDADIGGDPAPLSLQAWVLDDVAPGSVTITVDGDQDIVYGIALKSSGGYLASAGANGQQPDEPTLDALGSFSDRTVALGTLLPATTAEIISDGGDLVYQNGPDFNVNIHTKHANAVTPWAIHGGADDEIWTAGAVAFAGMGVEFTPSPCASLYFEADLVPGLSEGDTTDMYPLPFFGTADTENWGGGSTNPDFLEGFDWHETGAPGTNGPWMEQHNDEEDEEFPGVFHRKLIQNEFSDELDPDLYELDGRVLGFAPDQDQSHVHWTLYSVMWCSTQPEVLSNPDETTDPNYDYLREWFGTSSAWGLAYYSRGGQFYIGLHSGYDLSQFLELPVDTETWIYLEARQDDERLTLRVNDTEVSLEINSLADLVDDWDNSLQWGDFNHHAGWALLQICSTFLHCERRQTRRWEIQDKYGFARSPVEDCSTDPEPPPLITLARLRPQVTVVGF